MAVKKIPPKGAGATGSVINAVEAKDRIRRSKPVKGEVTFTVNNTSVHRTDISAANQAKKQKIAARLKVPNSKKIQKTIVKEGKAEERYVKKVHNLEDKYKNKLTKISDDGTATTYTYRDRLSGVKEIGNAGVQGALAAAALQKGAAGQIAASQPGTQARDVSGSSEAVRYYRNLADAAKISAVHEIRKAGSSPADKVTKQVEKTQKLEEKAVNRSAEAYAERHVDTKAGSWAQHQQKKQLKKRYIQSARQSTKGASVKFGKPKNKAFTGAWAKDIKNAVVKHFGKAAIGLLAAALFVVMFVVFFALILLSATNTAEEASSYNAKNTEINSADESYARKEAALQDSLTVTALQAEYPDDIVKAENIDYGDGIQHDDFALLSYLSVKFGNFTAAGVEAEIQSLFNAAYVVTKTEVNTTDVSGNVLYTTLYVTLRTTPLTDVINSRMNDDEKKRYNILMTFKGNRQMCGSPVDLCWYNYILYPFGTGKNPVTGVTEYHCGLDISVPENTTIKSMTDGKVTATGTDGTYGNFIVIEDSVTGLKTKYGHMSSFSVSTGSSVAKGQIIGKSGSTGSMLGSELYIEVMKDGEYFNPLFFVSAGDETLFDNDYITPGSGVNVGNGTPPDSYSDSQVSALFATGEQYLGTPYHLPGNPPYTFDCGKFVSWTFTKSGVKSLPYTSAQGLYNMCTPVSAGEAKAGDLIFFQGTYDNGRTVTHVGIYCGNGCMLHAGDPVKYTNINTTYWQQHFYSFGRIR